MVKTFDLRARERPLTLYGPPGLRALIEAMRPVIGRTGYPLRLVELEPHEEVRVRRLPDRRVPGRAPRHRVRLRVRRGRPARAASTPTPRARSACSEGPDFGRLQRGETVGGVRPEQVVGPERPGRRIVISGDTRPCQTTEVYAHGADVLVHEATFLEDERERARETAHSTAAQAAELARDAGVRLLALTHLSTRYFPRDVRDEARAMFPRHGRAARLRRDRRAVPRARRAGARQGRARARAGGALTRTHAAESSGLEAPARARR